MRSTLSVPRRPLRLIRNVFGDPAGSTAVIIALALSAIVGFAGLGTETASWYLTKRSMQGAADTAAATAAAELATNTSATIDQMRSAARSVASRYGFVNDTASTTVTINHPPASGTFGACPSGFAGTDCYVEVIITQPQTALLSAVFLSSGPTITARAVALANTQATDKGCVVALSQQANAIDINMSGTSAMNFSGCALYDNSPLTSGALTISNNAGISAAAAYIVGGCNTSACTGLTTTDHPDGSSAYTGVNPIADPYGSVPTPSYTTTQCDQGNGNGNNGYKLNGNGNGTLNTATLPPANFSGTTYVFCNGIDLTSANVSLTLRSGFTYIINKGTLAVGGNAQLTVSGSTIFLTNSTGGAPANVSITSTSPVSFTAPTTGATAGIALFQDRVTCTSNNNGNGTQACGNSMTGGSNQNITGAAYFPNNSVSYAGGTSTGGSQCTQLVAYTISFTGGSQFNSTCNSAGTKMISYTNGTLVM